MRQSFFDTWARRVVSFSSYGFATGLMWTGLPLWLALAFLVDLVRGQPAKRPLVRAVLFFAVYFATEILGLFAAFGFWLVTLGGLVGGAERAFRGNAALQSFCTGTLFEAARAIFGLALRVEGADLAVPAPYLLLVRHSSTADTMLAAAVITRPHGVFLRYVLKRELLWDPCLDVIGRRLPNVFVDRSGAERGAQRDAVGRLAEGLDERQAVLIYPEGTRFSAGKLARAIERLVAEGKESLAVIAREYRHVLPPRLGGPIALLEKGRGLDVVFLDQCGFEGAASFATFMSGALVGRTIEVRLRRVPADRVPVEGREEWLFRQWAETDRWLTAHTEAS